MFKLFKEKEPLDKFKKSLSVLEAGSVPVLVRDTTEIDLLKKQLADQEEVLRDLVVAVTFIANHKRFEHIQEKLIQVHNKLDKMLKL